MYTVAIFISILLALLLFIVGGIVGWIASSYVEAQLDGTENQPLIHPEFMDSSGNILPDKIIALRFTPKMNIEEDYYDTDDDNEETEDAEDIY